MLSGGSDGKRLDQVLAAKPGYGPGNAFFDGSIALEIQHRPCFRYVTLDRLHEEVHAALEYDGPDAKQVTKTFG